jgi:hypothetical protein
MSFDLGSSIGSVVSQAQSIGSSISGAMGGLQGALGSASRLAGALNNLSNPAGLISALRSINLPGSGGSGSAAAATRVQFSGPGNSDDWRVRLSIPPNFFASSDILAPLQRAGGLVFPYTPTISISHSAQYDDVAITHQNYQFMAYQNSKANAISISGPFNVEDAVQAQYWIAAVHFLRSATKMYTGDGDSAGSPPPILSLNGYGDFVFKNVPVVITSFSIDLPADANYIATTMGTAGFSGFGAASGGAASTISGVAALSSGLAGVAGALGAGKLATTLGGIGAAGGVIGGVTSLLSGGSGQGLGGAFPTSSGNTHVPNKSTLTVTVQPVYSREAVRQFSLEKFVNGGYVNGTGGYI